MKKLLILSLASLGAFSALSAPVSPDEALRRVNNDNGVMRLPSASVGKYKLVHTEKSGTVDAVYVFSSENGQGFLVAPADDCAPAILGFGDSKIYDEKGEMAPGFLYWINSLARQIEYSVTNPVNSKTLRISRPEREPIATLCSTRWNQSEPYNDQCPDQNGQHCVTGCVATAMAQVMKYHNWPEIGEGDVSIRWQGRTKKLNLSRTIFKWEDMLDSYDAGSSQASRDAVSLLMIAAGYSVDMNYSLSGSGAQSSKIAPSLGKYFKYDKSLRYLQRDYYDLNEWEDIIYNSLKNDGPVIYDGQAGIGGHSFVCDGYLNDGYFHFNWGWGGMSDGYFLLDALDPTHQGIGGADGGFDFMQDIIVGIRPDRNGDSKWSFQMICDDIPEFSFGTDDDGKDVLLFDSMFYNCGPGAIENPYIGMRFTNLENPDAEPIDYIEEVEGPLQIYYGFSRFGIYLPELEDGRYLVEVIYGSGDSKPEKVLVPLYYRTKSILDVENGNCSLDQRTVTPPYFMDMKYNVKINQRDPVRIKGTLKNINDSPYMCFFSEAIFNQGLSKVLAYSMPRVYDLDPMETVEIDINSTLKDLESLPDGEYLFGAAEILMTNGSVTLLNDPQPITVGKNSGIEKMINETMEGTVEYYTPDGVKIATEIAGESQPSLPAGLYIVKSNKGSIKVLIR